ncbi:MAG: winged helix-turn-helix domain-containing protein [Methylococcales bacterium]|nr:winged helix-turn-helix domain-containing protein [Methylococcales bacterium]
MIESIGSTAGEIWKFLDENGPSSVNKISTETGLNKNDIQRAIGWLAREDNIDIEQNGRTETISLKSV